MHSPLSSQQVAREMYFEETDIRWRFSCIKGYSARVALGYTMYCNCIMTARQATCSILLSQHCRCRSIELACSQQGRPSFGSDADQGRMNLFAQWPIAHAHHEHEQTMEGCSLQLNNCFNLRSSSASSRAASGNEVIGIDLGTTNSCVSIMEGKVSTA